MDKVAIMEKYLDDAQGALEDILNEFVRERNPTPVRAAKWFTPIAAFGQETTFQVGSALQDALERGSQAVRDLADHREALE